MNTTPLPPPPRWLPGLASWLDERLNGAPVQSVLGGRDWLSMRVGGHFLWILAKPGFRAAWLSERGIPRSWVGALGAHKQSPFAAHLRDGRIAGVRMLTDAEAEPSGLALRLESGTTLAVRYWPRPGVLWVEDGSGKLVVFQPSSAETPASLGPTADSDPTNSRGFDPDEHSAICHETLHAYLVNAVNRRLSDHVRSKQKRARRLVDSLEQEMKASASSEKLRRTADVLAAHLGQLQAGRERIDLIDFEGNPLTIELDPRLSPAANLKRMYKRARKAERKLEAIPPRLTDAQRIVQETEAQLQQLHGVEQLDGLEQLDTLVELASSWKVDLSPPAPGEHKGIDRSKRVRLPYWIHRLPSGREVWVGRSAKDNDELTFRRSAPKDLWLHAASVEGSHVIVRSGGEVVSKQDLEAAAALAAHFSKARHSGTVCVWYTERRYVRKARKSPPGTVVPERMKSVFVTPRAPAK